MSRNSSTFNISNDHLLLVDILNTMYNDNLRQIQNLTDSNNQIRNLMVSILYNQNRQTTQNNQNTSNRQIRRNSNSISNTNANNLGRITLNNRPYVIDSVTEFSIPLNSLTNLVNQNTNTLRNLNLDGYLDTFFEPVEIYPTPSQIEAATRNVRYCDIVTPINRSCPISLENFEDNDMVTVIRYCGHIFNTQELNTWFRTNCRCPVCRYDIRNYNGNNLTSENLEQESDTNSMNNITSNTNNTARSNNTNRMINSTIQASLENILNLFNNTDLSFNTELDDISINLLRNYQRGNRS